MKAPWPKEFDDRAIAEGWTVFTAESASGALTLRIQRIDDPTSVPSWEEKATRKSRGLAPMTRQSISSGSSRTTGCRTQFAPWNSTARAVELAT